VAVLGNVLKINNTIFHLNLTQNEISPEGGAYLFDCLSYNESVISLDLSSYEGSYRNKLGKMGMRYFRDIMCTNPNFNLQYFMIAGNYIGSDGV
jgi:hypothetical protein